MPRGLINRLIAQHQYAVVTEDNFQQTINALPFALVLLTGNPKDYPEANDVMVILPELEKAFAGRFSIVVVDERYERAFGQKIGVTQWPTCVFFKQGQYLDQIARMQDWSECMKAIPLILNKTPGYAPSIGIPVMTK